MDRFAFQLWQQLCRKAGAFGAKTRQPGWMIDIYRLIDIYVNSVSLQAAKYVGWKRGLQDKPLTHTHTLFTRHCSALCCIPLPYNAVPWDDDLHRTMLNLTERTTTTRYRWKHYIILQKFTQYRCNIGSTMCSLCIQCQCQQFRVLSQDAIAIAASASMHQSE